MKASSRIRTAWRAVLTAGLLVAGSAVHTSATELDFHGLLDIVASPQKPAFDYNVLTRGDSPFDPAGVRMFADAKVNAKTQVLTEVVINDASSLYLYGAYLMFTPYETRDLHVLAGKIPWSIGTWEPRAYSNKNPLVGAPLMYSHHSTLLWYDIPPDADALLATAGAGSHGVDYEGYPEGRGMPVIDDSYWDVGVTVAGSQRPFEYAVGVTAGTPSWGSTMKDDNTGKCVLGRFGLAPLPGLRFGVSGAYGPYLHRSLNAELAAGDNVNDYNQKLVMGDLEYLVGHVELRAEGARNFWETPTVGELQVTSGYVEAKVASPWGYYAAGRYDVQKYGKIMNSGGEVRPWDDDATRLETGVGYRFSRDVTGKVVYQRTRLDHEATDRYRTLEMFAAQVSVAF